MASELPIGISERVLYGAIIFATAKLVQNGYISADTQAYVAAGLVTFAGGAWAWWQGRPGRLMDRAAAQIPDSAKLVVTIDDRASAMEKDAVHDIARSAGDKVVAKVAAAGAL